MHTETVTLEVPVRVYTKLTALAAEDQADVVETLSRLVLEAHEQKLPPSVRALRQLLTQASDQPQKPTLIMEAMRQSLRLSAEQWEQLHQDTPSTVELGQMIGECLTPDTYLSAEIVAMREG